MSSCSLSSATVAVDKATSDLLLTPDWTMNISICDFVNSHRWQTKDVVKAVKRRLQHRKPKVQLLALTLLETIVKNCGEYVHLQIGEKHILGEMVKLVKKKADFHVRTKILVLLESWHEAFGGPGAKFPHYYWAFEELRRTGVEFPRRSQDAALIYTPAATRQSFRHSSSGNGMSSGSSRRLDETMATEFESLSLSSLESMRNVMDLLNDMIQAVNPADCSAIKDEMIVDLVDRCRSNQKKLMQMLTTTGDENVLVRGLELNDNMQTVLARHDAIASATNSILKSTETDMKLLEVKDSSPKPSSSSTSIKTDEEEEEEDDFAQLARRHSKPQRIPSQNESSGESEASVGMYNNRASHTRSISEPTQCRELALCDPPAPVRTTTKEQDIIDLLSITLSTTTPQSSDRTIHQIPVPAGRHNLPHGSEGYNGSQEQTLLNSYIVPWAQLELPKLSQTELNSQSQPESQEQTHFPKHIPSQPQLQPQMQPSQPQCSQFSLGCYPPPPWAASPQNLSTMNNNNSSVPWNSQVRMSSSYTPMQAGRHLPYSNSFPVRGSSINGTATSRDTRFSAGPTASTNPANVAGLKPFVPSYRLFEDLDVFWNTEERVKVTSNTSSSFLASPGERMISGKK